MKKLISILLIIASMLSILCSCSILTRDNISSVRVEGGGYYQTVYLYSFKEDQKTDYEKFVSHASGSTVITSGYIYSTEKLKAGDKIYTGKYFNSQSFDYGYTYAIVDKVVKTYRVKVQDNGDTYIITYYTANSYSAVTSKKDLTEVDKHKIEIVKEKVLIEYDV